MGDALKEYLKGQTVMRKYTQIFFEKTVYNYLDDAINFVFFEKENCSYSDDLELLDNPKTIEDFKNTITEKHFAWAIEHCKESSTNFHQDKYKKGTISEILLAYHDVYQYLIDNSIPPVIVNNNSKLNKEVREDIEDHLQGLIDEL